MHRCTGAAGSRGILTSRSFDLGTRTYTKLKLTYELGASLNIHPLFPAFANIDHSTHLIVTGTVVTMEEKRFANYPEPVDWTRTDAAEAASEAAFSENSNPILRGLPLAIGASL